MDIYAILSTRLVKADFRALSDAYKGKKRKMYVMDTSTF